MIGFEFARKIYNQPRIWLLLDQDIKEIEPTVMPFHITTKNSHDHRNIRW